MPISSSTIVPGYSDIETYVDHENDFVCIDCKLSCDKNDEFSGNNAYIPTSDPARIVAHLASHLSAGHLVPQPLIEFWQNYSHASRLVHYGIHHHRIVNDKRSPLLEREFANAWAKLCAPSPGYNRGEGLLSDLLWVDATIDERGDRLPGNGDGKGDFGPLRSAYNFSRSREKRWTTITPRDATIVATVIQWLGSNCGQSFLDDVFREAGRGGIPWGKWDSDTDKTGESKKSGGVTENKTANVSIWWWSQDTLCWKHVSGSGKSAQFPTRLASGKERHCVIVDGVEYYR